MKHQQIIPYFMVPNGKVFSTFLEEVFEAEIGEVTKSEDGKKIIHGEIIIGENVVFFAGGSGEEGNSDIDCSPTNQTKSTKKEDQEPPSIHMYIYVADSTRIIEKAKNTGSTIVMPITEDETGKMGGFLDPFNHLWWVKSEN